MRKLSEVLISPQRQCDRLEGQLEHEFDREVLNRFESLPNELIEAYRLGREDGLKLAAFRRKLDGA